MAALSSTQLAGMQAAQESLLPDTCTIKERAQVSDTRGGYTAGTPATIGTYPCRVAKTTKVPRELELSGKLTGAAVWVVTLPYDTPVTLSAFIEANGMVLEVLGQDPNKSWATALRVYCSEKT